MSTTIQEAQQALRGLLEYATALEQEREALRVRVERLEADCCGHSSEAVRQRELVQVAHDEWSARMAHLQANHKKQLDQVLSENSDLKRERSKLTAQLKAAQQQVAEMADHPEVKAARAERKRQELAQLRARVEALQAELPQDEADLPAG